jgi:hypothetical protein
MTTRTKVIIGLTLLVAFWVGAAVPAAAEARRVMSARITAADLAGPAGTLVLSVETERRLSAAAGSSSELAAQRVHTDHARDELRAARDGGIRWLGGSDATRQADALLASTERLPGLRAQADAGRLTGVRAVDAYSALLRTSTVYPDQVGGPAAGLSALSRSRQLLAEEDAVLAAVSGQDALSDADRVRLSTLAGARRELFDSAVGDLPASVTGRYRELAGDTGLVTAENALLTGKGSGIAWSTVYNRANTALWEVQTTGTKAAAEARTGHAVLSVVRAGVVGGVGLVAVIAVLALAWRSRAAATTSHRERRPVVQRSPGQDRATGLDPLLRDLERRNQGLLHRQLRLLDTLARRESDDDTLGDLFRADHLANRMRRNLEKAITLAGGMPGRRWRDPVPLTEVIRAAASEISEYGRVSTSRVEPATVAGAAVTDLMHLLAELIENAATFAPAETRVRVTGTGLEAGYRITVTDVGPGMTGDDLATAAAVMSESDPPAGGAWWGLYAAGRFAARQGVAVSLHNGLDGGLVAEVVLPAALIGPVPAGDDTTFDDLEAVISK